MNLITKIRYTLNNLGIHQKIWIPIFMVLVLILATCSSKKPETIVTTLENNQENVEENQILQLTPNEQEDLGTPIEEPETDYSSYNATDDTTDFSTTDTTDYSSSSELFLEEQDSLDIPPDLLAQIRRNLLSENYTGVLNLVEGRTDDASTYYRGIAYFVMMQERHIFSDNERIDFANQAESILRDVANNTEYPGLRARASLWYAVTLQAQYRDYRSLKTAVDTLYRVSQNRTARVYNDAVYYLGNVHAKMGWYGPARHYYRRVNGLNQNGDDRIYDYTDKAHYNTYEASQAGLERLREYMDGTHEDYGNY